jgi:hypothetical protein
MSERLRAKFRVQTIGHTEGARLLDLGAVYGKDGTANGQWSKFTPVGRLTMTVTNEAAFPLFEDGAAFGPGTDVLLDITVAPAESD